MPRKPTAAIAEPDPTTPAVLHGEGETVVPISRISHAANTGDEGQLIALRHGDERCTPILLPSFDRYIVLGWVPRP